MRAPFMAGAFPFPVKYGYATVGQVEAGPPELADRIVFSLHPHQSAASIFPAAAAFPVPDGNSAAARGARRQHGDRAQRGMGRRARSGRPHCRRRRGSGRASWSRYLCARLPARAKSRWSTSRRRVPRWRARSGRGFAAPEAAAGECDVVFHASGTAAGLATALALAGEEASDRRAQLVWRGEVAAPLGEAFHSRRLRLVSSQVGKVAPSHRPRWSHGRRLAAALALLGDPALDALLAPPVSFEELPAQLPAILRRRRRRRLPADPLCCRSTAEDFERSRRGELVDPCTRLKSPTRS